MTVFVTKWLVSHSFHHRRMRDLEIIKTQDCHYLLYMFFIRECKPLTTNSNIFLYVSLILLGAVDQIILAYSFHHEVAPRKV